MKKIILIGVLLLLALNVNALRIGDHLTQTQFNALPLNEWVFTTQIVNTYLDQNKPIKATYQVRFIDILKRSYYYEIAWSNRTYTYEIRWYDSCRKNNTKENCLNRLEQNILFQHKTQTMLRRFALLNQQTKNSTPTDVSLTDLLTIANKIG